MSSSLGRSSAGALAYGDEVLGRRYVWDVAFSQVWAASRGGFERLCCDGGDDLWRASEL